MKKDDDRDSPSAIAFWMVVILVCVVIIAYLNSNPGHLYK